MTKIASIEPLHARVGIRNQLLVKVTTEDGLYGWGESGLSCREGAVAAAIAHFADFLVGKDSRQIGRIWQETYRSQYFEGGRVFTAAMSAIDIALYDILGKRLGVPVYQLLGGKQRDEIPTFPSCQSPDMDELLSKARVLVDAGWDCAAVARSEHCEKESQRWKDLAKLESVYRKSLAKAGLCDVHDARRAVAAKPVLPEGICRVVLLGVTDLVPLVQSALGQAAVQGGAIESVVFGPEGGESLFDDWGRPVPERWAKRELTLANEQLHPSLDERTQVRDGANCLKRYTKEVYHTAGVGTADPKVIPHLERELGASG